MKNRTITILVAGSILMLGGYSFAQEADHGQVISDKQAMEDIAAKKAVEVGNTICPVSKEEIPAPGKEGPMGGAIKYEYNGKIYNLCCKMCVKDFKKDPEKYSKIAEDQAKTVQK